MRPLFMVIFSGVDWGAGEDEGISFCVILTVSTSVLSLLSPASISRFTMQQNYFHG